MARRWLVGPLVAAALAVLAPTPAPAGAAGMTTHAWMADSAIDLVDTPALAALLRANVAQVRSGARFPDGGYGPGNVYGEEAHWQRFADVYAGIIRDKDGCGDLAQSTGPCAAQVAHLMGIVAHGTGDEVWDWLFEPNSPDLDEYYLPEELTPFQDGGGQELVMDLVAIGVHDAPGGTPPPLPDVPDLLAAFEAAGQDGVTAGQLDFGQQYIDIVYGAESGWVRDHLAGVRREMPWMSHNLVTAPGGVEYAARAIAGQWEDMWSRLLGQDPTTEVTATYPGSGQRRIPPTGWVRTYQPGSHPGRGGARTRISASLSYALPYRHPGGDPVSEQLPAGAMTLTERDTATPVPLMAGYPRVVPYGPDAGTHTVDLQPAQDLAPCTWYQVDVTALLLDADGDPVAPASWDFRTGAAMAGPAVVRCADDGYTADELWLRQAYRHVLGREAGDAELAGWTFERERGMTTGRVAAHLVGSAEGRRLLATQLYLRYLERQPDASGLAYWAERMRTTTLTRIRAEIVGAPETYARYGGTDEDFVDRAYDAVIGRPASTADIAYWTGRLDDGLGRGALARLLLRSDEALDGIIQDIYSEMLGRVAGPGERAYWRTEIRGSDERRLIRLLVGSAEYHARWSTD